MATSNRNLSHITQPRKQTGEFDFKPGAEIPADAQSMVPVVAPTGDDPDCRTTRYQHLWGALETEVRVGRRNVRFACDADGRWTCNKDGALGDLDAVTFAYVSMDPGYWKPPELGERSDRTWYKNDPAGGAVWGGQIVCEMLNEGEIAPLDAGVADIASNDGVKAAMKAVHADRFVDFGRHHLSAAMARSRSAAFQLSRGDIERLLGGFALRSGCAAQATANAFAAWQACALPNPGYLAGIRPSSTNPNLCRDPAMNLIFQQPASQGGGYGALPDSDGDLNGIYHGEDGDLLLKILKTPVGAEPDPTTHTLSTGKQDVAGIDMLRATLDNTSRYDYYELPTETHKDYRRVAANLAMPYARLGLWAALHDDDIRSKLTGEVCGWPPQPAWIFAVSDDVLYPPDGSDKTIWPNVEQWRKGADILLDSLQTLVVDHTMFETHMDPDKEPTKHNAEALTWIKAVFPLHARGKPPPNARWFSPGGNNIDDCKNRMRLYAPGSEFDRLLDKYGTEEMRNKWGSVMDMAKQLSPSDYWEQAAPTWGQ